MAEFVVCNSVTLNQDGTYLCNPPLTVVTYTQTTMTPATVDFAIAGQWMSAGFLAMFVALGMVLTFRTIYQAIPKR